MNIKLRLGYVLCFCLVFAAVSAYAQPYFGWAFQYSTAAGSEGTAVALDPAGNAVVAGHFTGSCDFDPGPGTTTMTAVGNWDVSLAKYDAASGLIWAKRFGGTQDEIVNDMIIDSAGNIYVTGTFYGTVDLDPGPGVANIVNVGGDSDLFLAKYDVDGNYIWGFGYGGSGYPDRGNDLSFDHAGNILVTGSLTGNVDVDPGPGTVTIGICNNDWFAAKYSPSGAYLWSIANPNIVQTRDFGLAIAGDLAGNIYIMGRFEDSLDMDPSGAVYRIRSAGDFDIFLASYSSTGAFRWAGNIGNANSDGARTIKVDAAGNLVLAAGFEGTVDFDFSAGAAPFTSIGANSDMLMATYSSTGAFLSAFQIGGTGSEGIGDFQFDGVGNLIIGGSFSGMCDFDPSPSGTRTFVSNVMSDGFVGAYDPNGVLLWVGATTSNGNESVRSIAVNPLTGDNYFTGYFWDEIADFDPTAGVFTMDPSGTYRSGYVAKWTSTFLHAGDALEDVGFTVAPNPSTGRFSLQLDADAAVLVSDVMGKVVFAGDFTAGAHFLDLEHLASGVYFLRANGKGRKLRIDAEGN